MTHLILASQSLGRKKLLEQLHITFQIIPSDTDEEKIVAKTPIATLKLRAKMKGEDVYNKIKSQNAKFKSTTNLNYNLQPYLILSADSGVILGKELIGKPKNYQDAVRILKKLSGKTHKFVTAVYMIEKSKPQLKTKNLEFQDTSFVTFCKLSDEDIKRYLPIIEYTKLAGAYALYSGQNFITNVKGSLSNVIGLSLEKLIPLLKKKKLF